MSTLGHPKYTKSQRTGKAGESFVDNFIHQELGWIYRPVHQESDFGIDGYIDIVTNDNVTGQMIGVQIKCGDSYYGKNTEGRIKYEGENKHLNLYLNKSHPVILLILNSECSEGKWVEFNPSITERNKRGWWIEVPINNKLDISVKQQWESIAGPAIDHSKRMESSWKINAVMDDSDFGVYTIHKEDILNCDFFGINDVIDRLSRNRESLLNNRGTLEVLIDGYNDDPREIYEIPEVRNWYRESIKAGIPWFYFLGDHCNGMGLRVLHFSFCDINVTHKDPKNTFVEICDVEQTIDWLSHNYNNLNEFVEKKNIPEEICKEMSEKAYTLATSQFPCTDG